MSGENVKQQLNSRPNAWTAAIRLCLGAGLISLFSIASAQAATLSAAQKALFEDKVLPVLQGQCFECHSHAGNKMKGGLVLDTLGGFITGGDSGPAIVVGKPEESLLIKAIKHTDDHLKMPAKKPKLSEEEIQYLSDWIKLGAPWPGSDLSKIKPRGKITDEDRQWWSFQPIKQPALPNVKDTAWSKNELDRFILARLEKENLKPASEAERGALIRRVTFDLTGLPPTPGEVDNFIHDTSPKAYENLIDRLLASPRYGERWARHWLDLVRYADSDGYRIDDYRPLSWQYRDYVIKSFNADKPYNLFVKEQLAGDELYPNNPDAIIATGFLRHWIYEYNNRDVRGQWTTILNDITDTTGDVFFGMSLQCARCHDHKYDPLLQKDYFRLQAFFAPILPREDIVAATEKDKKEHAAKMVAWETKTAEIRKEIEEIEAKYRPAAAKKAIIMFPDEIQAMIAKPVAEREPLEHQLAELAYRQVYYEYDRMERTIKGEDKDRYLALKKQLAQFDKEKPAPLPVAYAATDMGPKAPPVFIPKKGKEPVEPGFLSVLDEKPATIKPLASTPNSTGRRATLAEWLTQPENPLTARVIVNRIWQYHFGKGLASSASDLGKLGEEPSHPELLDWMASQFVKDGWSLKKLHKSILMSATYRQSVTHPQMEVGKLKDPENKLYWRANVRRLDAEQIRDAIFSVTGELEDKAGGPGVIASEPRRSIYTRIMRNTRDPLIDVFDAPLWFNSVSARDTTTTPVQSLLLINSQLMLQRAKAFAERLEKEGSADEARLVDYAFQLAYGRSPSPKETTAAVQFIKEQEERIDPVRAGSAKAAFLYDKLPYRDGQAALMSPEGPQSRFEVPATGIMPTNEFTIESFVLVRSVYENGSVRTIAANWMGSETQPGWSFGITGKASRRKPQTLVLQLTGNKLDGKFGNEAIFSDQHIQFDKPYYVAASVKLAKDGKPGQVSFYVKDLSNDDEPLLIAKINHTITGGYASKQPFTIGGRTGQGQSFFDGLIDDVRLSNKALDVNQILFTSETLNKHVVGYWQFEAKPDVFRDATGNGLDIRPSAVFAKTKVNVRKTALIDFCHILLNSNEFLYVE
ncbi:MAG TPA: DUF1553 domain-containing protein [Verrucomicrobiae bacterium]